MKKGKNVKKHGCLWWLCVSWWWLPIKWTCYSVPVFLTRKIKEIMQTPATTPKAAQPASDQQPSQPSAPDNVKTYHAVGMNYRLDELLSLGIENEDYHKSKKYFVENGLTDQRIYEYDFYPLKIELVPEPDNPHDPRAIKVVVDGVHVAYIKAGSCAHLLKVIQENRITKIDCEIRGGKYKYVACEYDEDGNEEYTVDKDERPYTVTLYVTEE